MSGDMVEMCDTGYYAIIAQSTVWDAEYGAGSYCCYVEGISAGHRRAPNLVYAKDRADDLLRADMARDPESALYYTVVRDGHVYYTTQARRSI